MDALGVYRSLHIHIPTLIHSRTLIHTHTHTAALTFHPLNSIKCAIIVLAKIFYLDINSRANGKSPYVFIIITIVTDTGRSYAHAAMRWVVVSLCRKSLFHFAQKINYNGWVLLRSGHRIPHSTMHTYTVCGRLSPKWRVERTWFSHNGSRTRTIPCTHVSHVIRVRLKIDSGDRVSMRQSICVRMDRAMSDTMRCVIVCWKIVNSKRTLLPAVAAV